MIIFADVIFMLLIPQITYDIYNLELCGRLIHFVL